MADPYISQVQEYQKQPMNVALWRIIVSVDRVTLKNFTQWGF
jgi:hypothetical protein